MKKKRKADAITTVCFITAVIVVGILIIKGILFPVKPLTKDPLYAALLGNMCVQLSEETGASEEEILVYVSEQDISLLTDVVDRNVSFEWVATFFTNMDYCNFLENMEHCLTKDDYRIVEEMYNGCMEQFKKDVLEEECNNG